MPEGSRRIGASVFVDASAAKRELDGFNKKIDETTSTAERTSSRASAAMNGVSSSMKSTAAAIGAVSTAAAGAASGLNANIEATRRFSAGAAQAGTEVRQQAEAWAAQTAATSQAGEKANQATGFFARLRDGLSQTTNQISSQGTAWQGYDRVATSVAQGILGPSGLTVGMSLLLTIGGSLIGKLFELGAAKEEVLQIDKEQVAVDALRSQSLSGLSGSISENMQASIASSRVNADMVTSFRILASEQKDYEQNTRRLTEVLGALATKQHVEVVPNSIFVRTSTADLQKEAAKLNATLGEQEKTMQPAIESLKVIRAVYGFTTEQVIQFAEKTGSSTKQLEFFREQIDADLPALRALASEVANNTNKMVDMERQAILTGLAVQQIKPPKVDLDFLRGLNRPANDRIDDAVASAMGGFIQGPPTEAQLFAAIKPQLEEVKKEFESTAASIARNKAEALGLFNVYVGQLDPAYQKWIQQLKTASDNMGVFSEKNNKAEQEARALAQTTRQLTKEAELAQIKIRVEGLDQKEALVKKEFAFRVSELKRLKQATEQNLDAIKLIETEALIEISRERIKLEGEDRVKRAQLLEKGREDRQRMQDAEIKDLRAHMARQRQVREEEERKTLAALDKIAFEQRSDRAGRRNEEAITNQVDLLRRRLLTTNAEQGLSESRRLEINVVLRGDIAKLEKLGLTVNDVDSAFGSASTSVDQFNRRVNILAGSSISFVGVLTELIDKEAVLRSGIEAFTGAIAGAVAGTESLGRALLISFFRIIGEIAIQLGTLFVLAAAGFAFIPGLNWSAGALAAAGVAMLAFGAVMVGLASKFGQSNSSASGGSGSAASGSTGSTGGARAPRPPNVIPFPTSGNSSAISFDASETNQLVTRLLAKHQVITVETSTKKHRPVLKQAVGG